MEHPTTETLTTRCPQCGSLLPARATFNALSSDAHRALARALFLRLISPGATEHDTTRRCAVLAELSLARPQTDGTHARGGRCLCRGAAAGH